MRKIKLTKEQIIKIIKNNLLVALGTFILALGTELFLLPAKLITGGLSGLAICLNYLGIPIESELFITIATVVLFGFGLLFLGWRFCARTLGSTIIYPLSLYLIKFVVSKLDFLLLINSPSLEGEAALIALLSAIFGGVLVGAGCAITFLGGGSTGGVDIIAFIICKFIKKIKSSQAMFIIDSSIVILGFIVNPHHDLALCLEGVLSAFMAAIVIDKIFIGSSKMFVAEIVTDKYEEINREVIEKMDRTTSILDIIGGYSKDNKKMLMVSFSINEYNDLVRIVYEQDKRAFMTISRAHEIKGEGFNPLGEDK